MAKFKPINHIELGRYQYTLIPKRYKLKAKDLEEHGHVIGASKAGKSRFLASLYIQLLEAGYSVTLIDPHGDLAKLILSYLVTMGFFEAPGAFPCCRPTTLVGRVSQSWTLPESQLPS